VGQAIARGRDLRQEEELRKIATARLATLSPREREVLALLVEGRMNKAIAAELGISAKTVEDHRASIMRKMQVRSIAELVRLVADSRPRTAQ
jgi:FixJ family two-component response regulator